MSASDSNLAKIYIGTVDAGEADVSAYAAVSYIQIKKVKTIPQFGPKANIIKYTPLETGVVEKLKGSVDNGDPELVVYYDDQDAGQNALFTARQSKYAYCIKVVIPNAQSASYTDAVYYYHALITSAESEVGEIDNMTMYHFGMAITGDVLRVASAAS